MPSFHSWVCETLIGSTDPGQVTKRLTTAFIAFILLQVFTIVMPANYGRYTDAKSAISEMRFSTRKVLCHVFQKVYQRFNISSSSNLHSALTFSSEEIITALHCNWYYENIFRHRWSWVIQEAPAFLIPFTIMVESWSGLTVAKTILLAAFQMHYFNRYIL